MEASLTELKEGIESTYWESIPIWAEDDINFDVMADDISGRIPVVRLEHWRDFANLLESPFFNQPGIQLVFRGHRRFDWSMTPTLGRLANNAIVTEDLSNKQLTLFRQAVRGRINDNNLLENQEQSHNDELWAIGQHYGLMTPLLDWTYSPYVALFFAFAKEDQEDEKDNPYRAIYVLNKSFLEREEVQNEIRLFEPKKDDHGRLVSQAGLFTFSPTDATIENKLTNILSDPELQDEELANANEEEEANILAKYICKIYIKNEEQQACLKHLRRMNVHHASLFPDLLGASDYCNTFLSELEREKNIHELVNVVDSQHEPSLQAEDEIPIDSDQEQVNSLLELLNTPQGSKEVEPGRIRLIAEELEKVINKNKNIDWESREAIQARMRTAARVLLRKYGYPQSERDFIVNALLDTIEQ